MFRRNLNITPPRCDIDRVLYAKNWVKIKFENKGTTFLISFQEDQYKLIKNQILSTFKFLDQSGDKMEGEFCGGFAGAECPQGYTCKYEPNSDAGKCVKE